MPERSRERLKLITTDPPRRASFAEEVERGLASRPRTLPCRFFYDREGSRLFEEICGLPEYYPTRCELNILETRGDELAERLRTTETMVELGSGSATKTRILLDALLDRGSSLTFVPIDISPSMLEESARELHASYPGLDILGISGDYQTGLSLLAEHTTPPRLVLWLGSSVGNLDRQEAATFLRNVATRMDGRDQLLIGIDLRKDREILERAYDDAGGVTARFNLNLLTRINRELGADFDANDFAHRASYDDDEGRVEMHLECTRSHTVTIRKLALEVDFVAGETIHTENSYKYSLEEIACLARESGLATDAYWLDESDRFSLHLMRPDR